MKIIQLKEICDLQNGYAFKSSDYIENSNTLNCRMSNIRPEGYFDIDYAPKYLPDEYASKFSNYILNDGDLVIAMTDMANDPKILGVPTIVNTKGKNLLLNQRVGKLIVTKKEDIHIPFLQYALNRKKVKKYYTKFAGGGLQLNIGKKEVLSVEIPLPPLPTQKKIAALLDAADEYRQKTKALIEKYDQLAQSLFLDMFGDIITNTKNFTIQKLENLCDELFLGLTSKVDYVENGGYPLVRATDINTGILSFKNVKFISETQHKKLTSRRITQQGDVLISKSGSLGTCAIVDTDREFSTYESIFTVRTSKTKLNNKFLVYLVRNESFQLKLIGNKVGGTVAHLNLKMFREFEFPVPPINEQNQFSDRIQLIEQQKQQAQAGLQKAEDLFNSLLQRAFKGELV